MRHCIDLYALSMNAAPRPDENTKELAFNDFYCSGQEKLGNVQSFGRLPPAGMLAESLLQQDLRDKTGAFVAAAFSLAKPLMRPVLHKLFDHSLILATTLEDLPYPDNRVNQLKDHGPTIEYRGSKRGQQRIKRFRDIMADTLSPLRYSLIKQADNNDRLAHVCGTCRMGDDPMLSVVDRSNRAHRIDNLFVVDTSFFPTSAGTNPTLTVVANALRVGAHLTGLIAC